MEKIFLDRKKLFTSKKIFYIEKTFLDQKRFFDREKLFRLKNFLDQKKNIQIKKMNVARRLFNDQHPTTSLIDLFGKQYKIGENDKAF